jgi:hypothetical protein
MGADLYSVSSQGSEAPHLHEEKGRFNQAGRKMKALQGPETGNAFCTLEKG